MGFELLDDNPPSEAEEKSTDNKEPLSQGNLSTTSSQFLKKEKPPNIGTEGLLHGFATMPWLHAVANKVGDMVGQTSWRIFRATDAQGRALNNHRLKHMSKDNRDKYLEKARLGNLEEVESHPILDFLFFANETLHGVMSLKITQIHLDLVGEAFWIIERNALGTPVAWYPVPPHWVVEFPTPDRESFKIQIPGKAEPAEVPKNEIIPFIQPNPIQPYGRGVGTAQALGDELETDEFSSKFIKTHFFNNARPDLIISADNMKEEEARRLDQQWRQEHQGFFNSFKPKFISRRVNVQEIGQNFEHLQLVQLKEHERDRIISVFGVSPEMVGIIENSNRASIDASSYFFSKFSVEPRQEKLRNILQNKLIPKFDPSLILDFDSVVPEDTELQARLMEAHPSSFMHNEFRRLAGHDPFLDDDVGRARLLPLNEVEVGPEEMAPKPENGDQNIQLEGQQQRASLAKQIKQKYPSLTDNVCYKAAQKLYRKSHTPESAED